MNDRCVYLFHGPHLRCRADPTDRQSYVDCRPDAFVEQLSLEEDLSICDGDDVGRDVSRHIASLSLNDWQSCEGSSPELVVHLSGTFQQTTVQVEHITWVGLAARWTTQQQRHLSVCYRLYTR